MSRNALWILLSGAPACMGEMGGAPAGAGPPVDLAPDSGDQPLRRLGRIEYNNTAYDLLGDASRPADGFVSDLSAISEALAEQYMMAAETLAERAMQNLEKVVPCVPSGGAACARQFVQVFGKRAFRRPVPPDEEERLVALFSKASQDNDPRTAFKIVVEAMLQSPRFLYRVEIGLPAKTGSKIATLDSYEIASRLSYLLWSTMPDQELMAAADAGRLGKADEVVAQARRLLADGRAREGIVRFHREWLEIDGALEEKDTKVYPGWSPEVTQLLRRETDAFVDYVAWITAGSYGSLLQAPYTFLNAPLATFYGYGGQQGNDLTKVSADGRTRGGLLTHGSLLAALAKPDQSDPVGRGRFVRTQLLCETLPDPPDNLQITVPLPDPNATTRQRWARHSSDPVCSGCHRFLDPIGFGFENYDGVGRYRETENGKPIDSTGEVVPIGAQGMSATFKGPIDLSAKLAQSQQGKSCYIERWFHTAFGRRPEPRDEGSLAGLRARFSSTGGGIRELLVALAQTPAFLYRSTGSLGGAQ